MGGKLWGGRHEGASIAMVHRDCLRDRLAFVRKGVRVFPGDPEFERLRRVLNAYETAVAADPLAFQPSQRFVRPAKYGPPWVAADCEGCILNGEGRAICCMDEPGAMDFASGVCDSAHFVPRLALVRDDDDDLNL